MEPTYKAIVPATEWEAAIAAGDNELIFELLATPLHEGLNEVQDFNFMEQLTPQQRMVLAYDYLRMHILQGGFIQLIQNGYVYLIMPVIEGLQEMDIMPELETALDDALKIFVLNNEALTKETDAKAFAQLYEEFKEFEMPDKVFTDTHTATLAAIAAYAKAYTDAFIVLDTAK